MPPGLLFRRAQDAAVALHPAQLTIHPEERKLHAVYRVFLFKDDLTLAVRPHGEGTAVLYVRSASRVGQNDLGVNRRRVQRLSRRLGQVRRA